MFCSTDMKVAEDITDVDTSVHLLRYKKANEIAYFVIVRCIVGKCEGKPDARLLVVREKAEAPDAGGVTREKASDVQMLIGQLLIQHLINRKCLSATFKSGEKNATELILDIPGSDYYLRPIILEGKHMTSMKFFNEQHAAAYASDIIDALVNHTTDWTKLSIKDHKLTV